MADLCICLGFSMYTRKGTTFPSPFIVVHSGEHIALYILHNCSEKNTYVNMQQIPKPAKKHYMSRGGLESCSKKFFMIRGPCKARILPSFVRPYRTVQDHIRVYIWSCTVLLGDPIRVFIWTQDFYYKIRLYAALHMHNTNMIPFPLYSFWSRSL